jgi:hypothetical protein
MTRIGRIENYEEFDAEFWARTYLYNFPLATAASIAVHVARSEAERWEAERAYRYARGYRPWLGDKWPLLTFTPEEKRWLDAALTNVSRSNAHAEAYVKSFLVGLQPDAAARIALQVAQQFVNLAEKRND